MADIHSFLQDFNPPFRLKKKLAESGSGRENYLITAENQKYILTINDIVAENQTFFYLSQLFQNLNANVPKVLHISQDKTMYIQSFVGEESLLQKRLNNQNTQDLYENSLKQLARLQIAAAQIVDENQLFDNLEFNESLVYRDLFYFKNYFLDFTGIHYLQSDLLSDFEKIASSIQEANYKYFMLRDFQGRNILIHHNQPYFIDYQDAMIGPVAYDLVSLLWQAKAKLNEEEKTQLYKTYISELENLIPNQFNANKFKQDYQNCLVLRLLQVLGAYGKLGIIQNKPHFKESISYGIQNLKSIEKMSFMNTFPTLQNIIRQLDIQFEPKI